MNIGFIGHDFSEHPTAHMIEGVFVWHTRLADAGRKRKRAAKIMEARAWRREEGMRAGDLTMATAAADCCR